MTKQQQISWAHVWINYQIKYGIYSPEQFEGMTDEQKVEFAKKNSLRGKEYWDYREDQMDAATGEYQNSW